eukprot:6217486-Prymnesium_polylepis.1
MVARPFADDAHIGCEFRQHPHAGEEQRRCAERTQQRRRGADAAAEDGSTHSLAVNSLAYPAHARNNPA